MKAQQHNVNADGSVRARYKLCSDWDFEENMTLFERARSCAYMGCMGSMIWIYQLFGGEMKFMP